MVERKSMSEEVKGDEWVYPRLVSSAASSSCRDRIRDVSTRLLEM